MISHQLRKIYIFLVAVSLLFFLFACNSTINPIPTRTLSTKVTPEITPSIPMTSTPVPTEVYDHPPNPTPPPTVPPSPLLDLVKSEYLASDCSSPCMFDIVPGQTKADEIPSILETLQEEGIVQEYYLNRHPSSTLYIAIFSDYLGMVIEIDEAVNLVLSVGFGTGYRIITLKDIIDRFGEPTFVRPSAQHSYRVLYLVYPEENIFAEVRSDYLYDEFITPDLPVKNLGYETEEESEVHFSIPGWWVPWEGYRSFDYYLNLLSAQSE